jgi:DNA (cytosine-5)-methyltransferase 1
MVYYNENNPYAAQWLRNLIAHGLIAPGDVDDRSIVEVRADDLRGYRQVHLFGGIGGWSYALRLAGWADDRECWTGSCPCAPWSTAGKHGGHDDERHLWPVFFRLVAQRRPPIVFGEQVARKAGREWLCGVRSDLASVGYAIGTADLAAAGVGARHIRQRIFFVAVDDAHGDQLSRHDVGQIKTRATHQGAGNRRQAHRQRIPEDSGDPSLRARIFVDPDPRTVPHTDGISRGAGRVCAYGNSIVPEIAAEFVRAFCEAAE